MAKPKEVDFTFTLQSSGPIKTKKFQALVDTLLAQGTYCIEVEGDDVIVTSLTAGEVRKVEAEKEDVGPDVLYEQAQNFDDDELLEAAENLAYDQISYAKFSDQSKGEPLTKGELYEAAEKLTGLVPLVQVAQNADSVAELQTKKPENPCADLLDFVYEEPTLHE